jgi:hypothetical protein
MGALSTNFESLYGHKPQVISEAPGRVNLIGEHIDYSDGFVLPFAIADRTHAAIAKRSDGLVRIASNQRKNELFTINAADVKPGSEGEWEKYVLGVIWALKIESGLDILIDGTVPTGAGLSSSAALECSVAVALNLLFELNICLEDLARATQRAENEYVGMPCGIMDQSVSLMAQAGAALLLDPLNDFLCLLLDVVAGCLEALDRLVVLLLGRFTERTTCGLDTLCGLHFDGGRWRRDLHEFLAGGGCLCGCVRHLSTSEFSFLGDWRIRFPHRLLVEPLVHLHPDRMTS